MGFIPFLFSMFKTQDFSYRQFISNSYFCFQIDITCSLPSNCKILILFFASLFCSLSVLTGIGVADSSYAMVWRLSYLEILSTE